ncbi:MAG: type II secretion system protein GspK [Pseudomonadota bacterium]
MKSYYKQRASILIIVLWIISISIVLVSVLAKNTRLSATIVMRQQEALDEWSKMLAVINMAKMEVLLNQGNSFVNALKTSLKNPSKSEKKNYLFNGEKIKLSYPGNDDLVIRIYDLSGKINLSKITRANFKKLLQKKAGPENQKIDELLDAWQDWTDKDNLKRINGAEKNYYSQKELAYLPRNAPLQSVNELALIKGFDELFGHYDYSQVFTLYGNNRSQLNPNIANKETILLVPGIDEELAEEIISNRNIAPFANISEFNNLIPANVASKVKGWFALSKSRFYAIVIYSKITEKNAIIGEHGGTELYAYKEVIQVLGGNNKTKTLRVFPSYKISL